MVPHTCHVVPHTCHVVPHTCHALTGYCPVARHRCSIRRWHLCRTRVTGAGVAFLQAAAQLELLDLRGTGIRAGELRPLAQRFLLSVVQGAVLARSLALAAAALAQPGSFVCACSDGCAAVLPASAASAEAAGGRRRARRGPGYSGGAVAAEPARPGAAAGVPVQQAAQQGVSYVAGAVAAWQQVPAAPVVEPAVQVAAATSPGAVGAAAVVDAWVGDGVQELLCAAQMLRSGCAS